MLRRSGERRWQRLAARLTAATLAAGSLAVAQVPLLQRERPEAAAVSVRLMFGLDRFTPLRWDGKLEVSSGNIASLSGVHFEGRDRIVGRDGWLLTNRVTRYADSTTPRGYDPVHTRQFAMIPNGVVAILEAPETAQVRVSTEQGEFSFKLTELNFGTALKFLDGRASAERIPATLDLTQGSGYNDYPVLASDGSGGLWLAWISYEAERDAVWTARLQGGSWSEPVRVSPAGYDDNFRAAIAVATDGTAVVAWSGKSPHGDWGLFARNLRDGSISPVVAVASESTNLYLSATADSVGGVHVAWQGFRDQLSVILHSQWNGSEWSGENVISESRQDSWAPALAADSKGGVWAGWDGYDDGDFNIYLRKFQRGQGWGDRLQLTRSPAFDANVSLASDANDRLWVAWDHGEANWGKDWSSQRFRPGGGAGLYRVRSVKVATVEGGRIGQPSDLMAAIPDSSKDYVQQARLMADSQGAVWCMVRSLTSVTTRVNNNWGAGGIWEMLLTRLDEEGWTRATKLHATNGRNDVWASAAPGAEGGLWFAWARDGRPFGTPQRSVNRSSPAARTTHVSYTFVDPAHPAWKGSGSAGLTEYREGQVTAKTVHPDETRDTAAVRGYRYQVAGRQYRILRGDLHRHTDISSDGIGDGALIDFYRYALTAGQFDFMMVGDHQYGGDNVPGVEYNWWRTEKSEDIFGVPGRFLPLYGTERSIPYPNGHRNTVFARRGVRWMPIHAGERNGTINSGEILFPYLRRHGGISTPHTSGTNQGTDWRESDGELEPIVEIYQSLHASYEYPGAPRAETRDKRYYHHDEPWRPAGFVWEAWAKGIKIGVQASSDHVGTHDSYACVLVPADKELTRQDLIDAMKLRHTYAATDNIVVDMRVGDALMGDSVALDGPPVVEVKVIGTGPIERMVLVKNNEIVYTVEPGTQEAEFSFRDDSQVRAEESYYYIRAEQADGSLAWGSPIWVSAR